MKIKLDENLGARGTDILRRSGHDVASVVDKGLRSAADMRVADVCKQERRCLVTLDLDFGNPLRFRALEYHGIAVLRLPEPATRGHLEQALATLVTRLAEASIERKLWIVEIGRVREYQDPDEEMEGFEESATE